MLVDGPTSKMLLHAGPTAACESISALPSSSRVAQAWAHVSRCSLGLILRHVAPGYQGPQDLRARSVRQVPAGHRRTVVAMVGADISLPVLVVTIHLLAHAKDEGPAKYTRMIRPRQNHCLWKDLD